MRPAQIPTDSQECKDCHTVLASGARFCPACGGKDLFSRQQTRFPYDAIAAFIGVTVVIIYWLGRSN
jgi:hypothetical protein